MSELTFTTSRKTGIRRAIFGFDSAWTDSTKSPGALCALLFEEDGAVTFEPPRLVSFDQALQLIQKESGSADYTLVAIDQPTIVPNASGCRPAERVAGSVVSWIGGGVQPANRSKQSMFGDDAPLWRFKSALGAQEDPWIARASTVGRHLIEVFPVLALPSLDPAFYQYRKAPKYNPASPKFRLADWQSVCRMAAAAARVFGLGDAVAWCEEACRISKPRKADQDRLDAMICVLIALIWVDGEKHHSVVLGDITDGYIVAPVISEVRQRLDLAAKRLGVAIDGEN